MAASIFSRPNQARRNRRNITDQHPSNATLVPDELDDDDDFRPISVAPSNASGHAHLRSPHPGTYPIFDDLLPSNVNELGPPSARGYHTTSQFREKPLHAASPSKPQKKPSLSLKGVGKIFRRTFSRKHTSAPPPTSKRVPSVALSTSSRLSFRNPNYPQVSTYPIHSAPPSPTPTVQATEVMDVNIPDEHTQLPQFGSPRSSVAHHEYSTGVQRHASSALGRRATAPPPRRRRSSQSVRSFASSEPVSFSDRDPMHPHTPRVHPAGSIDPHHPRRRANTRLFVPPGVTATAAPVLQRTRIFTGPWYNRRGDMWIGVGATPGEFRVLNTNEMTFHPNFQDYPSEHGHFMNADGDVINAVELRMIRRADS